MESIKSWRKFLKTDDWRSLLDKGYQSDQNKKLPVPAPQKEYSKNDQLVELIEPGQFQIGTITLIDVIKRRRSRRRFTKQSLTLEELSFLLWATQGIQQKKRVFGAMGTLRTVPSGGARHPFETYLVVNNVDGLKAGLYRYIPFKNKLHYLRTESFLSKKVATACCGQKWLNNGAVIFIWTVIPYRTEWRYTLIAAKTIAQESGHICQNLYLACEAVGAGTCAVGAYYQEEMDGLIGVDGENEFVVYIAPVGKI
jgi:SagB-type dehydrogenase family enzyme